MICYLCKRVSEFIYNLRVGEIGKLSKILVLAWKVIHEECIGGDARVDDVHERLPY